MKLPKLMIGRWLKKLAKWAWEEYKDDILREIIKELSKREQGNDKGDGQ